MSFHFGSMIIKTVNNAKSKYKYVKSQYQIFEQGLNEYKKSQMNDQTNNTINNKYNKINNQKFNTPNSIKRNPFFWANLIKTKLYNSLKFLFESFKDRPKMITQEESNNIPMLRNSFNKISSYSKNVALTIIDTANKLILKISFGYIDLFKIKHQGLTPVLKNCYLIISKNFNYENLIFLYRKMGNNLNKMNKDTMGYLNKYKDPKLYEQYRKQYDNYLQKMNIKVNEQKKQGGPGFSNNPKFKHFFSKFSSMGFFRSQFDSRVKKINKYINSPWYKQKYYDYELKVKQFWNKKDKSKEVISNYTFIKEKYGSKNAFKIFKEFNYTNTKNFFTGGVKKQFRKMLFYIASFFIVYYSIKYFIYRMFDRRSDRNLEDALNAVKELKNQNEELMKYNRELIDKIIDNKRK